MSDRAKFMFVTCQVGAAAAVKGEVARRWPDLRFAYSRPGFLTFRLPDNNRIHADFELGSVFARAYGLSLGKVAGANLDDLATQAWGIAGDRGFKRVHVWARDADEPGDHGFEPGITPEALDAHAALIRNCPRSGMLALDASRATAPARPGDDVLDCVLVEPNEWWIGTHRVHDEASRWPGGLIELEMPSDAVSRAWLKMEEALRWSRLPISPGARVTEIGSSPGGASQSLLQRGFFVTGIDPAEMHPSVLKHPHFTHIRRRSTQVRRREFRKTRWLTVDMNVAPSYTLDAVEAIVTHPEVSIRGMILTLKLSTWELAEEVPAYLDRISGWGYNHLFARQLQHNHREFCVAAIQVPFRRKGDAAVRGLAKE